MWQPAAEADPEATGRATWGAGGKCKQKTLWSQQVGPAVRALPGQSPQFCTGGDPWLPTGVGLTALLRAQAGHYLHASLHAGRQYLTQAASAMLGTDPFPFHILGLGCSDAFSHLGSSSAPFRGLSLSPPEWTPGSPHSGECSVYSMVRGCQQNFQMCFTISSK